MSDAVTLWRRFEQRYKRILIVVFLLPVPALLLQLLSPVGSIGERIGLWFWVGFVLLIIGGGVFTILLYSLAHRQIHRELRARYPYGWATEECSWCHTAWEVHNLPQETLRQRDATRERLRRAEFTVSDSGTEQPPSA